MSDRKSLVSMLWLVSSLTLLASVLVVPMRTSGLVTVSSRPICLWRSFAQLMGQPNARLNSAMATDPTLQVNVLPSENEGQVLAVALSEPPANEEHVRAVTLDEPPKNEEKDWADAFDEPRVSFLLPCSFRKVPDRQLIAPPSIISLCPLRC